MAKPLVETLAYCRKLDKWLILQRAKPPLTWSTCTGGVEIGELYWQAALRELYEETGLAPERFYNVDFSNRFYRHNPEKLYEIFTFLAVFEQAPQIHLNEEHSEFEWVSLDEACARIPFAAQRAGLRHAAREFVEKPLSALEESLFRIIID